MVGRRRRRRFHNNLSISKDANFMGRPVFEMTSPFTVVLTEESHLNLSADAAVKYWDSNLDYFH